MAEMLKQLGGEGGGSEEDFSKMLMGMMEQLTNKEILYEPMKELNEKFPEWLEKNKAATSAEDLKRYEEQQGLVKEIVAKFEESTYSDSNATDREYIVERMQKVSRLDAQCCKMLTISDASGRITTFGLSRRHGIGSGGICRARRIVQSTIDVDMLTYLPRLGPLYT